MPEEIEPVKKVADEIWAAFCGDINAANVAKFVYGLGTVSMNGTKKIHVLFQSWGGFVGDGVFLHNILSKFPVEVVLYNVGQVLPRRPWPTWAPAAARPLRTPSS